MSYAERPPMGGTRRAREVPRGNGKTTTRVRIEALHDIAYQVEPFIVIVAVDARLARERLRDIRLEIEGNARFRRFFGDLVGDVWRTEDIETANGVRVSSRWMRGQIRGVTHPLTNARPTKFYLDDAEHSKRALSPELRADDRRIFYEDIVGAGTADGRTCFQFTGTPLHREALLVSLRSDPAWDHRRYPAIERWPDRIDLWDRCREIWAAAGVSDAAEDEEDVRYVVPESATDVAWRFYQANRDEMDRGARVLWPEGEPLFALMVYRWANGEAAFSKEKLLVPRDPSLTTFDVDAIVRHTLRGDRIIVHERSGKDREVPLSSMRYTAFHDPAKADPHGTRKALGDYAAIVAVGIESRETGGRIGHVVEAWLERLPISRQIEKAFEICTRWGASLIVEDDTYALISSDYRRLRRERGVQVPIKALERQTVRKDARIASLETPYANGWLTWGKGLPAEFVNQHMDHPTGDHDDGPDATEGAWRASTRKSVGLRVVEM